MVTETTSTPDFAVGQWVVRPTLSRIEGESGSVHITPRAMAVLVYLAAAGGRVVPRNELLDSVWPRMAVGPDAVSQCILELRKAFQDDARNPSVVETVPKIGVRLMVPVAALGAEVPASPSWAAPVPVPAPTGPPAEIGGPSIAGAEARRAGRRLRAATWGVTALVVAISGALGASWFMRSAPSVSDPLADAEFRRITDYVGSEESGAISPDGRFVAFVSDRDGAWDVWLGMAESGGFRNLTRGAVEELRNPAVRMIAFSPNGSDLLFWTKTIAPDGIITDHTWQVPVLGGEIRRHRSGVSELDWSSATAQVVYHPSAPGDPLLVAPADDPADGREIHAAPPGVHNHFPLWSHDGTTIFFAQGFPPDEMDLWQVPASGGQPERLTFHNGRVGFPVLLDERSLLYLATADDGSGPWIYALDLESRTSRRLGTGSSEFISLAASADGQRLVATEARLSTTLWRAALDDSGAGAPTAVSLPTSRGVSPRVGPGHLFYRAPQAGTDTLRSLAADGTVVELWNGSDGRVIAGPSVSPQGDLLSFSVRSHGRTLLYVMNVDGSEARKVGHDLDIRGAPAWGPSGEWLAVAAMHLGEPRLFKVAVASGEVVLLSEDYALDPAWSPSGGFIVYTGADVAGNIEIKAVDADGTPHVLPKIVVRRGSRRMDFLGQRDDLLVVAKGPASHKELWLVDLVSAEQRPLSAFGPGPPIVDFDVSPDGREIVFDRVREESDIVLISRAGGG